MFTRSHPRELALELKRVIPNTSQHFYASGHHARPFTRRQLTPAMLRASSQMQLAFLPATCCHKHPNVRVVSVDPQFASIHTVCIKCNPQPSPRVH